MVILFSERKSSAQKDIIEILTSVGADYISDKEVNASNGLFTIVSEYKKTNLKLKNGIAVICDNTDRFNGQKLPKGIIGVCEDTNTNALELFKSNGTPVISCGMGNKNTITLSSLGNKALLISLQRIITDISGDDIEPIDIKISVKKSYSTFSIMASAAVLLLKGIIPKQF